MSTTLPLNLLPDLLTTTNTNDTKCGTFVDKTYEINLFNQLRSEGANGTTFQQLLQCIPDSDSVALNPATLFNTLIELGLKTAYISPMTIGQALGISALTVIKGKKDAAAAAAAAIPLSAEAIKKAADEAAQVAEELKRRAESDKRASNAAAAALVDEQRRVELSKQKYPDEMEKMYYFNCNGDSTAMLQKMATDIEPYLNPYFASDQYNIFNGITGSECLNLSSISDLTFGKAWQAVGRHSFSKQFDYELTGGQIATIVYNSAKNGSLTNNMKFNDDGTMKYPFERSTSGGRKITRRKKVGRKAKKLTRRQPKA